MVKKTCQVNTHTRTQLKNLHNVQTHKPKLMAVQMQNESKKKKNKKIATKKNYIKKPNYQMGKRYYCDLY